MYSGILNFRGEATEPSANGGVPIQVSFRHLHTQPAACGYTASGHLSWAVRGCSGLEPFEEPGKADPKLLGASGIG
jgi:hypothetical protein